MTRKAEINETDLLERFNNRDNTALEQVYRLYYDDLHSFANTLYRDHGGESADAVHDTFLKLWQAKNVHFDKLINIKAYLFITMKNSFKTEKSRKATFYGLDEKEFEKMSFEAEVVESELIAYFHQALQLLPADCATIIRLFLEGYSIDEISEKTGKTKRTIYNKKSEAISLLRSKISKDKLLLFIMMLG